MKLLAWMLILSVSSFAFAQEQAAIEIKESSKNKLFQEASVKYSQGKYQSTIEELQAIEVKLQNEKNPNRSLYGLIHYWQGISYNRLQDYAKSIEEFDKSLQYEYAPQDIHYEYGQALFAAEKLAEARIQFRESLKRKFKRAVSLYYIAYISKEMGEKKKAFTFYRAIRKLPPEEANEVLQAAEFQIGDIYLEQVIKHPDAFRAVEQHVIPQYESALAVEPQSALAQNIRAKIIALQQQYDLVLFRLRNGRPTLIPPYFLRLSQEIGYDTNVTFAPQETTIAKSDQSSLYSRTDVIGRYTFYHKNYISFAPELRMNYTRYLKREKEIYRNDNYLIAPAIRTAYEHSLWKKPASILFDYDFNYSARNVNPAEEKLLFSSRAHTLMLGERFNYFSWGESTLRLRHRMFESFVSASDSKTTSLVFEQVKLLKQNILLFYASYDRTRVDNEIFDTDSFTLRGDFIVSKVGNTGLIPTIGLGLTSTDPVNNRAVRGRELLINPSARLSKIFKKNWRGNLKYDYQKNQSKDKANFAYQKQVFAFELEYLF